MVDGPSQTHRREVDGHLHVWDVRRLWELGEQLTPERVPLEDLRDEYEKVYWFGGTVEPSVAAVVDHARRIASTQLDHPIILSQTGVVMDGMHRVARALMLGHDHIDAVRFRRDPPPDRVEPLPRV